MVAPRLSFDASRITNDVLRVAPYLPLLALIALAIYPILNSGLPTTGDGLNHYYRLVELDWHIQHGDFYPRWFTNMGYGYGLPILNFYSPLTYYIPLVFRLFGLSLATSLQLSYALALAIAILGAYAWASLLTTELPSNPTTRQPHPFTSSPFPPLLVAAAYGLAPYFYFNIFHRGAYPETWALALLPWLLWSTHRLIQSPSLFHCSFFIFHFSFVILSHTLSALIFTPIIALYALALSLPSRNGRALGFWCLGFGICLLLTAFFTLPVLFESQAIQLQRTYSTGDLDYHRNFLTLAQLFSPPPNFDPQLVFNSMPPSLAWPQVIIAISGWLLAVGLLIKRLHDKKPDNLLITDYWLLLSALCLLLSAFTLSISEPFWNLFPFARFIQFPWRLVGPASLFLAALAGLGFVALTSYPSRIMKRTFIQLGFWALGFGSFFFFSLPWTYHADFNLHSSNLQSTSPADTIRYELTSGQLGTSSTGEYLPKWVTEIPNPQTNLAQFNSSDLISHLAPPPLKVEFEVVRLTPTSEEINFNSPQPFTATFNLFYFPGWVAEIDGQQTDTQPSSPNGHITVAIPIGPHTLKLYRQLTPPQLIGTLISVITLLALVSMAVIRLGKVQFAIRDTQFTKHAPLGFWSFGIWVFSTLFIVSLLIARIFYFDRADTIFHHPNPIPNPTSVNFDNQLELIGYEYPRSLISNSPVLINLYWRALQPLTANYSVSVQLADRLGNRFGQSDSQHPNGVPTSRWRLDQYARDSHPLLALEGTPPGHYRLLIIVYSDRPLSVIQDSAPSGVEFDLGSVQIEPPPASPAGPLALLDSSLSAPAGPGQAASLTVGDPLTINALWFTGNDQLPPLTATVELTDNSGQIFFSDSQPPTGIDYPTEQWVPNTVVRYPITITLPPDLPAGTARVRLSLTTANGAAAAGPFDLGSIRILIPERSFDLPAVQVRVDHDFENTIRLLGYDLQSDSITLYWQALKVVPRRLTVFVHTLNESGAFESGHDAQPTRPTTSWLPGEVIADRHPIVVGKQFEVGLYEPITGGRFGKTFVTQP